ncbi:MAG TPA: hypothetical protein DEG63_00245 [Flavobacteriaceae bacterium]|nr:hypothetical protein [Flavobacteriaceae bacterium]
MKKLKKLFIQKKIHRWKKKQFN